MTWAIILPPDRQPSIIELQRGGVVGLQISVRESRDVAILELQGRLTTGEDRELLSQQLRELIGNGKSKLLLNLVNLTQIDSSGVSIIARTHGSLKRQGGNLGLRCPSGHVLDVFRVLHLLEMIPNFEDEAQALASFQSLSSPQSPKVPEGTTLFG
jgi:anti-anti-sigma factor